MVEAEFIEKVKSEYVGKWIGVDLGGCTCIKRMPVEMRLILKGMVRRIFLIRC